MPDAAAMSAEFERRRPLLEQLRQSLVEMTCQALEGVPHIDRIAFRVKDSYSFGQKAAKEKYTHPLSQIEDQVAGRVITFFRDDIVLVRERLTKWLGDVEHQVKEPLEPDTFGYESDHFVFVIPEHRKPDSWNDVDEMPTTFELQIRTLFMHAWAEPQHDLGYKGAELDRETKKELAWIAASAWGADRTLNDVARRLAPDSFPQVESATE